MKHEEAQEKVCADWQYIRHHSGSLILSGLSDMFYPRRHKKHADIGEEHKENFWQNVKDNLPFYLAVAREGLALVWQIGRPFYLRWIVSHRK